MQTIKNTQNNAERIEYVDIFRGIALLIMVSIQIFDFLSVSNIYLTPPFYVAEINSVTWLPPSLLFTFVSGMSIFLLISKLLDKHKNRTSVFRDVFLRYGKYILISLPFTTLMWNFAIYFRWEEAIQGIGLSAIVVTTFVLFFYPFFKSFSKGSYAFLFSLIILFSFLQSILPHLIDRSFGVDFPRDIQGGVLATLGGLLLNMLFRSWFSIVNLFPIMLGGIIVYNLLKDGMSSTRFLGYTSLSLFFTFVLHFIGFPIDYYGRSFNMTFYAVAVSAWICAVFYFIWTKVESEWMKYILNFFKQLGYAAFFLYIGHYLLILKLLEITGYKDLLPDLHSWILTVPLVGIMYLLSKWYITKRKRLPKVLQL